MLWVGTTGRARNETGVNKEVVRPMGERKGKLSRVASHSAKEKQRGVEEPKIPKRRNERRKQHQHVVSAATSEAGETGYKPCEGFKCKEDEMCVVDTVAKQPVCTSKPAKVETIRPGKSHHHENHHESRMHVPFHKETAAAKSEDVKSRAQLMKEQAKDFEQQYRQNQKSKLHQTTLSEQEKQQQNNMNNEKKDKTHEHHHAVNVKKSNTHHHHGYSADCSQSELSNVADDLLDQFKVKQDQVTAVGGHRRAKRNSTKKELHEDDECMCQAPVSWQFTQLDSSGDVKLGESELKKTLDYLPKDQRHCAAKFYESCDRNKDGQLSEKEWCCCFAHVLPPCLSAQRDVPHMLVRGEPARLGDVFVPECDSDGFFSRVQCRRATGECWCVDRKGSEMKGTLVVGTPNCN